ncbi:MAG: HAMP domain-containing sensor histidine kinase [Candidatus Pacebacteria bacterium]|nr:HAMP domain-containing sensor histidine kinase [Candidatus Paceibacterota bacterium]
MYDVYYIAAFSLMLLYYYTIEYKLRYDFFYHVIQGSFQKSYKKFMSHLPNGLILLDKSNIPVFYNRVVMKMVSKKLGSASSSHKAFSEQDTQLELARKQLMDTLEDIRQRDTDKRLREVIEEWKGEDKEDSHRYVYHTDSDEVVYNIRFLKLKFQGRTCKALILQDFSAYDKLNTLDDKYQKLYVASIVHDIRTPLNSIMGMLEMLNDANKLPNEKLYLAVAIRACKLLLFLTNDITDYSQLEAQKFRPNNFKTAIRDAVGEATQLLAFNFEKKKIHQITEISDSVPKYVCIDKNRYLQILLNLLGNALKFTFQGQVKINLDHDSMNDILITSVRDTGIGIKPEDISKLFKLFGKLEVSQAQNPQGVGFGLAISKRLAESMDGYINVISKVGYGSTFTFGIKANSSEVVKSGVSIISGTSFSGATSFVLPGDIDTKVQSHNSKAMFMHSTQPFSLTPVSSLARIARIERGEAHGEGGGRGEQGGLLSADRSQD